MFGILDSISVKDELVGRYLETKSKLESFLNYGNNAKIRIYDIAEEMGISEAELLSVKLGSNLKYLYIPDHVQFFNDLKQLNKVMFLTRNENIVHEKIIMPNKLKIISDKNNFLLTLDKPLLKYSNNLWKYAFSETKVHQNRELRSFQFFNNFGNSVLKIYLKSNDKDTFNNIASSYEEPYNYQLQKIYRPFYIDRKALIDLVLLKDSENVSKAWKKSTYFSQGLIRKLIQYTSEKNKEVNLYIIGNASIQYHIGRVNKVVDFSKWLNILDSNFNIHIKEHKISSGITYYHNDESCHIHFFNNDGNILCGMSFNDNIKDILNIINPLTK